MSPSVPEWMRHPVRKIADVISGTPPRSQEPIALPEPQVIVRARVLCVDDNPQVLRLLKRQLEEKYDVSIAQTAQDALALLAEGNPFDVIISDLRMPDVHGLTFLKMARDLYPTTERIILTGLPDPATMSGAGTASAAEQLILKPWTRSDLALAVESAVLRRREFLGGA
ncbi:MAG: response regulator [Gemmatimonadota bacterium]|nr:response regulator [Gemmatimonadota bacterium]